MAKKEKSKDLSVYDKNIEMINIADACMEYMQIFGANNNLMRHLPEIFDGLKIGERRILYSMYIMGLGHNKPRTKVKNIVGFVMKLHPHGDAAIEDTLVRMAQPWNNIQVTVDKKGNFGSQAGEPAADGRYTEARLSYYAYKCFFEEMNPKYVDMRDNYTKDIQIPEVLPAKYPNVLINNTFGIGYGLSTSIPTHNFREVCEATIELIKNPDADIVLYPDSPTGSFIVDEGQFGEISSTGKGKFRMRGVIEVNHDLNALDIKSTPILTTWMKLKVPVIKMLSNEISEIKDMSEIGVFKYRIFLKKEVDPVSVMNEIYAKTPMEKTFGVQYKLTEDYADEDYNIKDLLLTWIDFRREMKRRIYTHKFTEAKERQHLLEILLFILNKDNAETTISIMKNSNNRKEATKALMNKYGISSLQAEYIADCRMSAFTKDAYKRYLKEKEDIKKEISEYDKIIHSIKKIDKIIISELEEGIELFGTERKSKIITIENEVKVRDTEHVIVFTTNGNVKKLLSDVESIGDLEQGDSPAEVIVCRNTNDLLVFDERGKIFKLPVSNIPGVVLTSPGVKLSTLCNITGKVTAVKPRPVKSVIEASKKPIYFIMITKNGYIKKTNVESYVNIRNELNGIVIKDDDSLVCCKLLTGDSDLVVYSSRGYGIRFNASEIKDTGRLSVGVKAMDLGDGEEIIGLDILNKKDKYLLVVTEKGYVKKCSLSSFDTMTRNSTPLKIVSLEPGDGVKTIQTVKGSETINVYLKSGFEALHCSDIPELPRMSKGKKLISVRRGDMIIDVKGVLQ